MSRSHEAFEELCALAAIDQLTLDEFTQLQEHLDVCAACRDEYAEYQDLVHNQLPLAAPLEPRRKLTIAFSKDAQAESCRQRFLAEARQRGFQFSPEAERGPGFWRRFTRGWKSHHKYLVTILALLAVLAAATYRRSEARHAAELAELYQQNAALRERLATSSIISPGTSSHGKFPPETTARLKPQPATLFPSQDQRADEADDSRTGTGIEEVVSRSAVETELARIREDFAALQARAKAVEEQLHVSASQSETFKTELEASKTTERQLTGKLQDAENAIREMTGELRSLRERRLQDAILIANQESQLKDWTRRSSEQIETLDRQKTLLNVDRDIRDIMTARNLHIIDVRDVDGAGRDRRPVGRIFYTENRSLVFYAFELDDKRVLQANYTLQAWGYREANDQTARSLGMFYVDDKNQKRWALKFDDPRILQQIDAVFVTIEPPGGSQKPTGQKLLYAYLKNKPNHP